MRKLKLDELAMELLTLKTIKSVPIGTQISLSSETSFYTYIGFFENILKKNGTNYVLLKNAFAYQKGIEANKTYLDYFLSRLMIPIRENKSQLILEIVKDKSDKSKMFKLFKKEYYKHITKGKITKDTILNKDIWYNFINVWVKF